MAELWRGQQTIDALGQRPTTGLALRCMGRGLRDLRRTGRQHSRHKLQQAVPIAAIREHRRKRGQKLIQIMQQGKRSLLERIQHFVYTRHGSASDGRWSLGTRILPCRGRAVYWLLAIWAF